MQYFHKNIIMNSTEHSTRIVSSSTDELPVCTGEHDSLHDLVLRHW